MKKLLWLLTPIILTAEMVILHTTKVEEEKGKVIWVMTACRDGVQYTLVKQEPFNFLTISQDIIIEDGVETGVKCEVKDVSKSSK